MQIKIDHFAKIEGHMGFVADIINNRVQDARLKVTEGARLIEGILLGRHYYEAPEITSRICGVCPVVHNLTAIKALEAAFKIKPSQQTQNLRSLMMLGQMINSHSLHLFFFSLADFFGIASDLDLIKNFPQEIEQALKIRAFGNLLVQTIGGRTIHPLRADLGGFRKLPSQDDLLMLKKQAQEILPIAEDIGQLFIRLKYPAYERETEYISLASKSEYAIYDGDIKSTQGLNIPEEKFMFDLQELEKPQAVAKRPLHNQKSFMVGALARLNNNSRHLSKSAQQILKHSGLSLPCFNPFYNILAQTIELVHCIENVGPLVERILANSLKDDRIKYQVKPGQGVGAIEAPRGTLYHYYEIDQQGLIKNCNLITPTAQNLANIEDDLKEFLPHFKTDTKRRKQQIKMLVRAYDPCITCATH